jgi:ribosomal protein L37AE/L43A/predicted nuclease of predicted toxin-antitoxin system
MRSFDAYGDLELLPDLLKLALTRSGVNLLHVPARRKNSADFKIVTDLYDFVAENDRNYVIALVSSDQDFLNAAVSLRRKPHVVRMSLIHKGDILPALKGAFHETAEWSQMHAALSSSAAVTRARKDPDHNRLGKPKAAPKSLGKAQRMLKSKGWECEECKRLFDTEAALDQHQAATKHGDEIWECEECGRKFETEKACEQHQEALGHGEDIWTCGTCDREFGSEPALLQHETAMAHGTSTVSKCRVCQHEFASADALAQHRQNTGHHRVKVDPR